MLASLAVREQRPYITGQPLQPDNELEADVEESDLSRLPVS